MDKKEKDILQIKKEALYTYFLTRENKRVSIKDIEIHFDGDTYKEVYKVYTEQEALKELIDFLKNDDNIYNYDFSVYLGDKYEPNLIKNYTSDEILDTIAKEIGLYNFMEDFLYVEDTWDIINVEDYKIYVSILY